MWDFDSVEKNIRGTGNEFIPSESSEFNFKIDIVGNGNKVFVEEGALLRDLYIRIWGDNNVIKIGNSCIIQGRIIFDGHDQLVDIGDKTTFERVAILSSEGADVIVGKDCMLSFGITIRTTDAHSVIDLESNERINKAQSIIIDDHVWLGQEVMVLKGVKISKDCVVGARSIVSKSLTSKNCAYAGIPAKLVKANINWLREKI